MNVGKSFGSLMCASTLVVLTCGSTQSLAQNGEYYVVGQGASRISVLQGGGINRQWSTVNGTNESPIHVSDFVYTTSFNSGQTGGGMLNFNSSPTVTDCAFSENSSDGNGGGMLNNLSSLFRITKKTYCVSVFRFVTT